MVNMCHNRKISRLHKRCFRSIYSDRKSSFEKLLEKDNTVSIYHRSLGVLAVEMYKVYAGTSKK